MTRRYFIIKNPNEHMLDALSIRIGHNIEVRHSLDNSKGFIKTNQELITDKVNKGTSINSIFPPGVTTEYNLDEVRVILRSPEWLLPLEVEF